MISITESQILAVLRTFILSIVPAGIEVTRGLTNRVDEPAGPDFITMTPIMRERLEWNTDTYDIDTQTLIFTTFTTTPIVGQTITDATQMTSAVVIAVTGMTVTVGMPTAMYFAVGDMVTGVGTIASVAYGGKTILQPTSITVQLDIHGPNSADYVQGISTLFRDQYAYDSFAPAISGVSPLYVGNPTQMSFENAEQQIEERWVLDVVMQANIATQVQVQYMSQLIAGIYNVDATYPPVY